MLKPVVLALSLVGTIFSISIISLKVIGSNRISAEDKIVEEEMSFEEMDGILLLPLLDCDDNVNNNPGSREGKKSVKFYQSDSEDEMETNNYNIMSDQPRPLMTLRQRRHSKLMGTDMPNLNLGIPCMPVPTPQVQYHLNR